MHSIISSLRIKIHVHSKEVFAAGKRRRETKVLNMVIGNPYARFVSKNMEELKILACKINHLFLIYRK